MEVSLISEDKDIYYVIILSNDQAKVFYMRLIFYEKFQHMENE